MKFRTDIRISPFSFSIEHPKPIVLLGSCFSNNIGLKLKEFRFKTTINPHGIVFNPHSLAQLICNAIDGFSVDEQMITELGTEFKSFAYHSDISAKNKDDLIQKIAVANVKLSMAIKSADTIFLTLGSSWVYEHIELKQIVSNCHKVGQKEFNKKLLSYSDVFLNLQKAVSCIQKANPSCKIVFTISPIRHIKDGIVENQRSKSHLIAAVHQMVDDFENCFYFPSYELIMDDLRDYRFYERDLIHLNNQAVDYIWEKFGDAFFNDSILENNKLIKKLNSALNHKLLSNDLDSKQKFISSSLYLCEAIEQKINIELSKEKAYFNSLSE